MENLLWLGEPCFAPALAECGWNHVHAAPLAGLKGLRWPDIVARAGFSPDVAVVAVKDEMPAFEDIEEWPFLTILHSLDTHLHSWHGLYAQSFDAALVSQEDNMAEFVGSRLGAERVWASPPYAGEGDEPDFSRPKIWDCLFVSPPGAGKPPAKSVFLRELEKLEPGLRVMSGDHRELFPQARVIVNQAERGDLNGRVFEAMGCGACLVTPRVGHGMARMFVDGEHLVAYAPNDAGDAAWRIRFLLEHPDVASHIRRAAYEEINARHRARHRAEALGEHLFELYMNDVQGLIAARREWADVGRRERLDNARLVLKNYFSPSGSGR